MKLYIGERYVGTVTEIKPYGAVLTFEDDSTQLLHISHFSDEYVQNIADFVNVGDSLEVYAIPGKVKSVELTIRQSEIDRYETCDDVPFEELLNYYPPNERDIKYKDRYSMQKNHKHQKKKKR